jgi:tetratricopeptide (TPR) repeat protein
LHDSAGLSRTLKVLALTMLQQGKYDEALEFAWTQRRINEARDNQIGISEANLNIAWAYADRGQLDDALGYLRHALEIPQRANHIYGMITAHSDMAGIFFGQGDYSASIEACLRAYNLAITIGYMDGAGTVGLNMGGIYRQECEYQNALTCYTRSLAIRHQIGNVLGVFISIGNIAIIRAALGDHDRAQPLFQKAIQLGRSLNNPYWMCEYLFNFAESLSKQNQLDAAITHNKEALEIANQLERRDIQFQAQMLAIRLEMLQNRISREEAVRRVMALVSEESPEPERAAALYTAWEIDSTRADLRDQASALYHMLYDGTPTVEVYRRYQTLTGETLPAPPPLPPLPESILHKMPDLDALLEPITV